MPDIVCPDCGLERHLVSIRRAADEFCTQCDFPLFWAPSAVPMATPGASSLATRRRLPGAGGRQRVGSRDCPECGELNPLTEVFCIRCSSELDPKPVEVVTPPPVLTPPKRQAPQPKKPWWPIPAIAAVIVVELVLLIVALT